MSAPPLLQVKIAICINHGDYFSKWTGAKSVEENLLMGKSD